MKTSVKAHKTVLSERTSASVNTDLQVTSKQVSKDDADSVVVKLTVQGSVVKVLESGGVEVRR